MRRRFDHGDGVAKARLFSGGHRLSRLTEYIAQDLEILVPEREIGFEIVAFGPFVPRFDEDDAVFAFSVANSLIRQQGEAPRLLADFANLTVELT